MSKVTQLGSGRAGIGTHSVGLYESCSYSPHSHLPGPSITTEAQQAVTGIISLAPVPPPLPLPSGIHPHGITTLLCLPGSNMLLIGVHGPTTPCEEVSMKHVGNQQYNVTYVVKEKGDYVLAVKWGEEHIPGSPFHVTVP